MNNGLDRFSFYLLQIKELSDKASMQKDPALWLFRNNARTTFFMLEGLARLYKGLHNPKKFGNLNKQFKLVEDILGQIDFYNWLYIAFKQNKQIPSGCKQFIKNQMNERAIHLNKVLSDKEWLSDKNKRIKKITKKLNETDWLNPVKEIEAISDFYKTAIGSINKFGAKTNYHFDNVEKDVHELRRKLRWLSIYPQALQGAIQYAPDIKAAVHLGKYLTEEITNSPFNKLPATGNNNSFLLLHKNYFLALSWMIAQLGSLKDEGLLVTGLCESIKQSTACSEEEALTKAYAMLGRKQRKMKAILDDAESITKTFLNEKNLQRLIAGKCRPH